MAMARLVYVTCDECGTPATDPVGDAKEARSLVPTAWFRFRAEGESKTGDYCPSCGPRMQSSGYEQPTLI